MEAKAYLKWSQDATRYSVIIVEDEDFLNEYGGRYMTTIFVGSHGSTYFLNEGYQHWTYLLEHYPNLTHKDAKNVADKLNQLDVFR